MGTFIITTAIFALCVLVFQYFWKAVLKACYYLLLGAIDVVRKIIVATKRFGKCAMYLYRRWKNGKITRVMVETEEEEVDIDMLPQGLQNELEVYDEVIVKRGDISPEEF